VPFQDSFEISGIRETLNLLKSRIARQVTAKLVTQAVIKVPAMAQEVFVHHVLNHHLLVQADEQLLGLKLIHFGYLTGKKLE
jgi:hypothetical protein